MWNKYLAECTAMMIIGDGTLAVVDPKRHAALWNCGPRPWKAIVKPFIRNPNLTRCLGVAGVLAGIWLAQRQQPGRRHA